MASARNALQPSAPAARGRFLVRARQRQRRHLTIPRLSVVIVNYGQWENTAALARRLLAARCMRRGAAEIVVVDNHSPAHRLAARVRRWPGVSLRRWGRNRGFACAVNEGCRLSRGEWFLLLNPDVSLPEAFVDEVLAMAETLAASQPRAGVIGFRLHNSDGSRQLSTGPFPTLAGTLTGLLQPRDRRKYQVPPARGRCRVPWVTGCCLLVRRACLQDVGGFDEDYFLYYEDVDLCRRAQARGWSVWYEPALWAFHHGPLHGRSVSPLVRLITRHSLLTYAARHWPAWQFRALTGIVRGEAWLRRLRAAWRGDPQGEEVFSQLGAIAAELARGRRKAARRQLNRVLRRQQLAAGGVGFAPVSPVLGGEGSGAMGQGAHPLAPDPSSPSTGEMGDSMHALGHHPDL